MNNFPDKPENKKNVYMDHAATTYVHDEVMQAMYPFFNNVFANPSGLYAIGREANGALNSARRKIADIMGTQSDSIFFTGGGTESDNLAIFGIADQHKGKGRHIITTKIEHHAVLHPCEKLEKEGFEVTYLDVDKHGFVELNQLKKSIKKETILISVMYANNEVGTVQPIADIGREILKWRKANNTEFPYFHTDACQAAGTYDLNVEKLHVDLMTINGSKIYGPKGVGVLYKRRGVKLTPQQLGGGQEMGLRSGTENVPAIVGIAKALELAQESREAENLRLMELRAYFWDKLQATIQKVRLNGPVITDENLRLPNNLNVTFMDVEGEALLLYLDEYGIVCSTGSACTSSSLDASHVLLAMGLAHEYAHGTLRFSLGKRVAKEDVDYVMEYLPGIVEKLREISPVNLK